MLSQQVPSIDDFDTALYILRMGNGSSESRQAVVGELELAYRALFRYVQRTERAVQFVPNPLPRLTNFHNALTTARSTH